MDLIYGVSQVLHRIKLKLYPNYLPGREGTFLREDFFGSHPVR
jgi:hypothetical protein